MVESGHLTPERPGRYDIRAFLLRGENMTVDDPTIKEKTHGSAD
jgi:hypothetical protein